VRETIGRLEQLGFPSLWYIEAFGREPLTQAALLLGATERMTIAPGIANVWSRDATAMEAASRTLSEAYPGRFVLGLGISHGPV
jgi:alkanesulfonate monooxygenase SsuD/methylene tetrahydromethanopterin reductase-like flavin-dependent oxidoreductase (luciferase family)